MVFFTGLDDLVSKIVDEDSSLFAFNGTNNNSCDTAIASELDTFLLDRSVGLDVPCVDPEGQPPPPPQ